MPTSMQAGDVLAERYRLDDLLAENGTGRFWRAHDLVLHRAVSVHLLPSDDERAGAVLEAARGAGPVIDRRLLRVLDAESADGRCYVVNEWGQGDSLDILVAREGPLPPRRAAWLVAEVADTMAEAHAAGLAHGRLVPENVLVDQHGQIRIIGFGVDAALRGLPAGRIGVDEIDLAGLLYCALTGKWAGASESAVPAAPEVHGEVLRPRRVRAGIPRMLDALCDQVLNPQHAPGGDGSDFSARSIRDLLHDYVGDLTGTHVPVQGPRPRRRRPRPCPPSRSSRSLPTCRSPTWSPSSSPSPSRSRDPEPGVTEVQPAVPDPAPPAAEPTAPVDLPTQAGMPVFHDDDEVDWLRARAETARAPAAARGPAAQAALRTRPARRRARTPSASRQPRRVRQPRLLAVGLLQRLQPDSSVEASRDSGVRPAGRDTGSWSSGSWSEDRWSTGEGLDDTGDQVPGRSWFRLAMIVGICVLVMVAAVAAYQLGLPTVTDSGDDDPTTSASPSPTAAEPTPFTDLVAAAFDPQGTDDGEENSDSAPNVVDGDATTVVEHLDLRAELRSRRPQDRRRPGRRPRRHQGRAPGHGDRRRRRRRWRRTSPRPRRPASPA